MSVLSAKMAWVRHSKEEMSADDPDRPIRATSLTFDLRLVVTIAGAVASLAITIWASTAGLRSDVRDILTKMESARQVIEVQQKLQDERMTTMRDKVDSLQRRLELLQFEQQGLKETILRGSPRMDTRPQ